MNLLSEIRTVQDFPKPGINFFDVTSILEDPILFRKTVKWFSRQVAQLNIQSLVGIDARGFIWASAVAADISCPLYLARKPGKLPGKVVTKEYDTEYSVASLSMLSEQKIQGPVLVIDDILATGGTLNATGSLLTEHWGIPPSQQTHAVLVELGFLPGRQLLEQQGYKVISIATAD